MAVPNACIREQCLQSMWFLVSGTEFLCSSPICACQCDSNMVLGKSAASDRLSYDDTWTRHALPAASSLSVTNRSRVALRQQKRRSQRQCKVCRSNYQHAMAGTRDQSLTMTPHGSVSSRQHCQGPAQQQSISARCTHRLDVFRHPSAPHKQLPQPAARQRQLSCTCATDAEPITRLWPMRRAMSVESTCSSGCVSCTSVW